MSPPNLRVLVRLDAELLDRVIGAFPWTRTRVVSSRKVIAVDGKTVRMPAPGPS